MHEITQRQARAIGAEAEIGGVAEAQDAGEAQQQIEPHGGEAEDQNAPGERGIAAEERQPERRGDQRAQMATSTIGPGLASAPWRGDEAWS